MGIISSSPGAALAFSSASGGKMYGYNNIGAVTPVAVAPSNPSRQRITFHNPGDVDMFVWMTPDGNGAALSPTVAAPGGSFRIFANGGTLEVSGECQFEWYALAASSTNKALTVMDSNT